MFQARDPQPGQLPYLTRSANVKGCNGRARNLATASSATLGRVLEVTGQDELVLLVAVFQAIVRVRGRVEPRTRAQPRDDTLDGAHVRETSPLLHMAAMLLR